MGLFGSREAVVPSGGSMAIEPSDGSVTLVGSPDCEDAVGSHATWDPARSAGCSEAFGSGSAAETPSPSRGRKAVSSPGGEVYVTGFSG